MSPYHAGFLGWMHELFLVTAPPSLSVCNPAPFKGRQGRANVTQFPFPMVSYEWSVIYGYTNAQRSCATPSQPKEEVTRGTN